MNKLWNNLTPEHVLKAIELFESEKKDYPKPRNTFLIFNGKKYPAKHIRGLAYQIANNTVISIKKYSGGQETINFFKHLGFSVEYKKENVENLEISKTTEKHKTSRLEEHKIARLVVTRKQLDWFGYLHPSKLQKIIEKFLAKTYKKMKFEFILTPGGFLNFDWPKELHYNIDIKEAEKNFIPTFFVEAEKEIDYFFDDLPEWLFKQLRETTDYFTIGIDGFNPVNDQSIELIAVYDLKKQKVIHWTGKFYPVEDQKNSLVKINDLNTHFIKLNNQNIVILGCHDLSVFNPRGQANANPNSWKKKTANEFKRLCQNFNPDIILQHPHYTDTPNIWNLDWRTVEKELPNVKHFASGINFSHFSYPWGRVRGNIDDVLKKTKKGDVIDYKFV